MYEYYSIFYIWTDVIEYSILKVVANTATEERHRKLGSESSAVTLEASPTLRTEIFKTTYTYLTLNAEYPDEDNALRSSQKVITNTVTVPQYYLDMILEASQFLPPRTNTYISTRRQKKTYVNNGLAKIETNCDTITQVSHIRDLHFRSCFDIKILMSYMFYFNSL